MRAIRLANVQWDNSFGLGLLYMHARHYSPVLGRFIQPDPARADMNTYAYASSNPMSRSDPSGRMSIGYIPPWILGRMFERYAQLLLVESGWDVIRVRFWTFGGARIVDVRAVRYGQVKNFEIKYGNSWYGGRQLAFDLEAELMGQPGTYVVRGRMVEGYMFKVDVKEASSGRDVTGRVFRPGGRGGGGGYPGPRGTGAGFHGGGRQAFDE